MAKSSPKIKIQYVPIGKLHPADYNPRVMPQLEMRNLIQSFRTFGNIIPIVVNKDQTIIGGEQRWRAARTLGHKEIPVVYIDVDKADERDLNLRLNKIGGRWDRQKLANVLFEEQKKFRIKNIDLTGFDRTELSKLHLVIKQRQSLPEIVFSEELGEEQNFVVLFFTTDLDWKQFESLYTLPQVQDIKSRVGFEKKGIGRVISGTEFLEAVLGDRWHKKKRKRS